MAQATARITLPDRYRIVRHVANGGMASVWEAHDEMLDRAVAVKVLSAHLGEDERARKRFQREARTAAGLSSHPHVVTIFDVGEHDGRSFIVMELLRGGTVADRLRSGERIPLDVALRWLEEAASALDAAHEQRVVHRDVKPANMLLDERDRLALADFGIARLGLEDQITQTGQVLGTAAYIAPEQAMGDRSTPASDRYALAVVAFELLTGERPFKAENFAAQARAHVDDDPPLASERNPQLPRDVDAVLARGMAKSPAARYPGAGALVASIEDALAAPGDEPTRPTAVAPPTAATRRIVPIIADPDTDEAEAAAAEEHDRISPPSRRAGATWDDEPDRGGGRAAAPPARGRGAAPATSPEPRRRWGAPLLAVLAALLVGGGAAFALLGGSGDGGGDGSQTQAERPTATATATPERTSTPEPTPTPTATPEDNSGSGSDNSGPGSSNSGSASGNNPATLQARAFSLNNQGNYDEALPVAQRAVELCQGSTDVNPCAYALFEYARSLRATGNPQQAVTVLEERLQRFPDDQRSTVEAELRRARRDANQG